jgi:DNA replication protein DnaD
MSVKRKSKKQKEKKLPKLNKALQGFDIFLDEFGRVKTNENLDHINNFLNQNLVDLKLEEKALKEENTKNKTSGETKKK